MKISVLFYPKLNLHKLLIYEKLYALILEEAAADSRFYESAHAPAVGINVSDCV